MKRYFIACGSEALKGLKGLVARLHEEGIYNQFSDKYLAIDSDTKNVEAFQALQGFYMTDRVKGAVLTINPAHDDAVSKVYRENWDYNAIPAGGVGGKRSISAKAAAIIDEVWNDVNFPIGKELQPDDQIVIVGSAFGGTAGGLFLNFAQYIDYQIREKRVTDENYKNVEVLGVLLMPEAIIQDDEKYSIAVNMVEMFRDLQAISWQRSLESSRMGFHVPTWSQLDRKGNFPLFTKTGKGNHRLLEYGVSGSTLPFGTLYLVPTPARERHLVTDILAENLFAASYLHVDEGHARWIDRVSKSGKGPVDDVTCEDRPFAGFNMIVMKSGRLSSLKKWFYDRLHEVLKGRDGQGGLLCEAGDNSVIRDNICEVFMEIQIGDRNKEYKGVSRTSCQSLDALLKELDGVSSHESLRRFRVLSEDHIRALAQEVPAFPVYPAKTMMAALGAKRFSAWNKGVNFALLESAYEKFITFVLDEKAKTDYYFGEMLSLMDHGIACLDKRLKSRVVRGGLLGLDIEHHAAKEVISAVKERFQSLLNCYLFAARCHKSDFMATDSFKREVEEYKERCALISERYETIGAKIGCNGNPYIIDGRLADLDLPEQKEEELNFDPFRVVMLAIYRACVSSQENNRELVSLLNRLGDNGDLVQNLEAGFEKVLDKAEEKTLRQFAEICGDMPKDVNPLNRAGIAPFDPARCETFCPGFALNDSDTFHYHFCIRKGEEGDGVGLFNKYVGKGCLNLNSMPNITDDNGDFLSASHASTADRNFWKDENSDGILPGMEEPERSPLRGIWLGTLGINFGATEMLKRIYSASESVMDDWRREGSRPQTSPMRLMNSVEMVRFGLVMEAIEDKLNEVWKEHLAKEGDDTPSMCRKKLAIRFRDAAGNEFSLFGKEASVAMADISLASQPPSLDEEGRNCSRLVFSRLPMEWCGRIFRWIRRQYCEENGFLHMLDIPEANFRSIAKSELDVFNDLRFHVTEEELRDMDAVKARLVSLLQITLD